MSAGAVISPSQHCLGLAGMAPDCANCTQRQPVHTTICEMRHSCIQQLLLLLFPRSYACRPTSVPTQSVPTKAKQ
jgi:hypothetical protein